MCGTHTSNLHVGQLMLTETIAGWPTNRSTLPSIPGRRLAYHIGPLTGMLCECGSQRVLLLPELQCSTGERCNKMMRNPSHIFRRMWSVEPWGRLTTSSGIACWNRRRDAPKEHALPSTFFSQALNGTYCDSNWYVGHAGQLGKHWSRPHFTAPAPALLGFDDSIANFCESKARMLVGRRAPLPRKGGSDGHIRLCLLANMNILNLIAGRVPYNLCRNLEWQVCAATGKLPGQPISGHMFFADPPSSLDPSGMTGKHRQAHSLTILNSPLFTYPYNGQSWRTGLLASVADTSQRSHLLAASMALEIGTYTT